MTADELVEALRKPMFNYTMAKGAEGKMYTDYPEHYRRSVETRLDNALETIDNIVRHYVDSNPNTLL